jgi:ribosomal protein S18 acetylase RimI-like enzyme
VKIAVTSAESIKEIRMTVDFLARQPLDYPKYQEWVGRAEAELFQGHKRALLAFLDGHLVADLVWQPHKQVSQLLEIKNLRVHPRVRQRDFGRFLLRQVETLPGFAGIICDVRENETGIRDFMVRCGYTIAAKLPLYESTKADLILTKLISLNYNFADQLTQL